MKFIDVRSGNRLQLKWLSGLLLAAVLLMPRVGVAQQATITFTSPVSFPPEVDATNFINLTTWNILTSDTVNNIPAPPYKTADTLNFTNKGTMISESGWEFDFGPSAGNGRFMAANFLNDNGKTIQAVGFPYYIQPNSPPGGFPIFIRYGDYLWVTATNIINKGTLIADSYGEVKLVGSNVNLSRSTITIPTFTGDTSTQNTNYTPSTAIYDRWWAQTNRSDLQSQAVWDGTNVALPPFTAFQVAGCGGSQSSILLSFVPSVADSITNSVTAVLTLTNSTGQPTNVIVTTNIFKQAAFINTGSGLTGAIRFAPTGDLTNLFETITVQLNSPVTGDSLYVQDTLGSSQGRGLLPNNHPDPAAYCSGTTFRPTNYIVSRTDPGGFGAGTAGLGVPPTNFFYSNTWSNRSVTATYAAYTCIVDNYAYEPLDIFGVSSFTNLPGRIKIVADTLNLTNATLLAQGLIQINANHLISSEGASLNCPNFSYDLGGPTNGSLIVTNLAPTLVARLNGDLTVDSAVWSNLTAIVLDNYAPVTTNMTVGTNSVTVTNWVYSPYTNYIQLSLHALVVDASSMAQYVSASVYDLKLHSTNIVVNDSMSVVESFLLDGPSFTLNGSLSFPGTTPINFLAEAPYSDPAIVDWTAGNAPALRYFTNNGTLSIANEAHFGDDGPTNYAAFVNLGSISAYFQVVNSSYFENDGSLSAGGAYLLTAGSGKFTNGKLTTGSDVQFNAGALKFVQSTVQSGGELDFSVTGSLSDAGAGSANQFSCDNGFNLSLKPAVGDLLGSTLTTVVPAFAQVTHTWAGANYGVANAGYTNNAAIGRLVLTPLGGTNLFEFAGAGANNGLYVDYLDLSQMGANFTNAMQIDDNLVIYYAAASLSFTPPPAGPGLPPQEPEEYLNGMFGGHLRWVSTYAGPNSSVAVLINGQTYIVNKALRFATTIDSNTNGIPNYADPNPFSVPPPSSSSVFTLQFSLVPPGQQIPKIKTTNQTSSSIVALSWLATTNTPYFVQYTTNLVPTKWQTLATYTNKATTNQDTTVLDTNSPAGAAKRFYRVGYGP